MELENIETMVNNIKNDFLEDSNEKIKSLEKQLKLINSNFLKKISNHDEFIGVYYKLEEYSFLLNFEKLIKKFGSKATRIQQLGYKLRKLQKMLRRCDKHQISFTSE